MLIFNSINTRLRSKVILYLTSYVDAKPGESS